MRNALQLITVFLFLLLGFISSGQVGTTNKFPEDSAFWYEYSELRYHSITWPLNEYSYNTKYYFTGEDIIDNDNNYYKVVYQNTLTKCLSGPCLGNPPVLSENNPADAALRVDSNKVYVFYYNDGYLTGTTLYDYSIEVGDTFTNSTLMVVGSWYLICNSIDSVLTNTGYRKRWNFQLNQLCEGYSGITSISWTEGITSSLGLFYDREILRWCGSGGYFNNNVIYGQCFIHRDTVVIGDNYLACEDLLNSYKPSVNKPAVSILPNPAQDYLIVNLDKINNLQLELFDTSGRRWVQQKLNTSQEPIDISTLPNGVYICTISNNGLIVHRQKVVVSR